MKNTLFKNVDSYPAYDLFYTFFIIHYCLTSKPFILVPSCDRRVSSAAVPSAVRHRRPLGQLDARRRGRRRLRVGGTRLQSERVHDVAHFLLCQFPVLLPAAGAPEGETQPNCRASLGWRSSQNQRPVLVFTV